MGILLGLAFALLIAWVIKCACSGEWVSTPKPIDDSTAYEIARNVGFKGTYKEWLISLTADGEKVFGPNVGPEHELFYEMNPYWYHTHPWVPTYTSVKGRVQRLGIPYRNPYVPYTDEWSLLERPVTEEEFNAFLRDLRRSYAKERHERYVLPTIRTRVKKQMRAHRMRPARPRSVTV